MLQEFKVDGFNDNEDELIKFAYQEKEKHTKSLKRSNEGGWHSPEDYAYNDNILSNIVYRNLTNDTTLPPLTMQASVLTLPE